jgi:hypothetical protein
MPGVRFPFASGFPRDDPCLANPSPRSVYLRSICSQTAPSALQRFFERPETNCNRFSCRRIRMRQRQGNERNRRKPPPRRMRQKKKALQLRESSRKSSPSPSQFRSGRNAFVRGDEPFRSCVLLDSRSKKCMSCAKVTSCVPHLSRNQPAEFVKGLSSADNSTKKVSA